MSMSVSLTTALRESQLSHETRSAAGNCKRWFIASRRTWGGGGGGEGYIQYTSIFRPAEVVMVPAILRWQLGGWDFGKIMVRSQEHSCSCYIPCT